MRTTKAKSQNLRQPLVRAHTVKDLAGPHICLHFFKKQSNCDHSLSIVIDCGANHVSCCANIVQAFKQWSATEINSNENVNLYWEVAPKNEVGPGIYLPGNDRTIRLDDCCLGRDTFIHLLYRPAPRCSDHATREFQRKSEESSADLGMFTNAHGFGNISVALYLAGAVRCECYVLMKYTRFLLY